MRDAAVARVTFDSLDDPEILIRGERLRDDWTRANVRIANGASSLMDLVDNDLGVLVVSPDSRAVLEHNHAPALEFLPITIVTEDGGTVADDFFIANNRVLVDAIDLQASSYSGDEDDVGAISKLVLKDELLMNGPRLMRAAARPDLVLIRDDLLTGLQASGLAGFDPIASRDFSG